ncbi:MAG: beta-L-arabinofuranosidase domain-containing protein, partial [Eubacteriales bacterium]
VRSTDLVRRLVWLRRQLEIQANGLSGNLDLMWPDVKDSAWIGGSREGWERVPYWLDGFIPLAYLLKNEDMISRAKKYIDAIIHNQKEDGWICPCSDEERQGYDIWALFLICKVLVVYHDCSGDERIENVLYCALKNCYDLLNAGSINLFAWGESRWFECFISLSWLSERKNEAWIISLGEILREQGADYGKFFDRWKVPLNVWTYETHIVNIAMALKCEAMTAAFFGEKYTGFAEKMTAVLDKYNGTAVGLFTGDECLSGLSPIQGTELCAVVEQMYSYEQLLAFTGKPKWADSLEKLAYNALPSTISEDMRTHQYVQMANQISCQKFNGKSLFRTNGDEAHLFGLEPNFGCCTANFNQGWAKFALSTFMLSENGIVSAVLAPAKVSTKINGIAVSVELQTEYPFKNSLKYIIETEREAEFDFSLRIPSWSKTTTVNNELISKTGFHTIRKIWSGRQELTVSFAAEPVLNNRPNRMKSLAYGPFVMALPVAAKWKKKEYMADGVERKAPYCDYELIPTSDWNYAFASENFAVAENDTADVPFSEANPSVQIKTVMKKIDWGFEDGYNTVCRKTPKSRTSKNKEEEIFLIPYGCTKLRMTEMPQIMKQT